MPRAATTRKATSRRTRERMPLVQYTFEGQRYTLDLNKERVYRDWMAVEAQRSFTILGAYRQESA